MITEIENLENMQKCPRFESCDIPKCPLDYFMKQRAEIASEDKKCVLQKFVGGVRTKRTEGILSAKMKGIAKFIPSYNKK